MALQEIDVTFQPKFEDKIWYLLSQEESRLLPFVYTTPVNGSAKYVDQLGSRGEMKVITNRHSIAESSGTDHYRRKLICQDFYDLDFIDIQDASRTMHDMRSPYARRMAEQAARHIDKTIYNAALASVTLVDSAGAESSASLGSANTVDDDITSADTDWSLGKILRVNRIFDNFECNPNARRIAVINAQSKEALMGVTQIQSFDYNTAKALAAGQLNNGFAGLHFVIYNNLAAGGEANTKYSVVFEQDSICLGYNTLGELGSNLYNIKVAQEGATHHYRTSVYSAMSIGAVRMEEKRVVRVEVKQT